MTDIQSAIYIVPIKLALWLYTLTPSHHTLQHYALRRKKIHCFIHPQRWYTIYISSQSWGTEPHLGPVKLLFTHQHSVTYRKNPFFFLLVDPIFRRFLAAMAPSHARKIGFKFSACLLLTQFWHRAPHWLWTLFRFGLKKSRLQLLRLLKAEFYWKPFLFPLPLLQLHLPHIDIHRIGEFIALIYSLISHAEWLIEKRAVLSYFARYIKICGCVCVCVFILPYISVLFTLEIVKL